MRVSKHDRIPNIILYRMPALWVAVEYQISRRTVYTLRQNRLRHGKASEVIRDLLTMTDTAFLERYKMRKRAMRKRWGLDD